MRVILMGSGELVCSLARGLADSRHEIVALVEYGRLYHGGKRAWLRAAGAAYAPRCHLVAWRGRLGAPLFFLDNMDEAEWAPLRVFQADIDLVGGFAPILKDALQAGLVCVAPSGGVEPPQIVKLVFKLGAIRDNPVSLEDSLACVSPLFAPLARFPRRKHSVIFRAPPFRRGIGYSIVPAKTQNKKISRTCVR